MWARLERSAGVLRIPESHKPVEHSVSGDLTERLQAARLRGRVG